MLCGEATREKCAAGRSRGVWRAGAAVVLCAVVYALAGCSSKMPVWPDGARGDASAEAGGGAGAKTGKADKTDKTDKTDKAGKGAAATEPPARDWAEYRLRAARKIVAANPDITHLGVVEQPALAIPVIQIELLSDGRIKALTVMRYPSEEQDTVQIALDAIKRAAPFGSVKHLPRPWKFSETFLFNEDRRFKPRILD